jgi:hypothetical protein
MVIVENRLMDECVFKMENENEEPCAGLLRAFGLPLFL